VPQACTGRSVADFHLLILPDPDKPGRKPWNPEGAKDAKEGK
jgi:hypothetical protein